MDARVENCWPSVPQMPQAQRLERERVLHAVKQAVAAIEAGSVTGSVHNHTDVKCEIAVNK